MLDDGVSIGKVQVQGGRREMVTSRASLGSPDLNDSAGLDELLTQFRERQAARARRRWLFVKYALDRVVAAIALILVAPTMGVIALAVRLSGPGPVYIRQQRIGRNGEIFDLLKYRTTRPGDGQQATSYDEHGQLIQCSQYESQLTRVGSFLRRSSLDELPQLFNVLAGEMSLIGPRPVLPQEFSNLLPHDARILEFRPGLISPDVIVPDTAKLTQDEVTGLELGYVDNWSLRLDYRVLLSALTGKLASSM